MRIGHSKPTERLYGRSIFKYYYLKQMTATAGDVRECRVVLEVLSSSQIF
jgi:hypothetical protein